MINVIYLTCLIIFDPSYCLVSVTVYGERVLVLYRELVFQIQLINLFFPSTVYLIQLLAPLCLHLLVITLAYLFYNQLS